MGARKKIRANAINEAKANKYFAKLNDCPTSPRKMRLVADQIRGVEVFKALGLLQFSKKEASVRLEKLLKSAIHNYETKTGVSPETGDIFVKLITVDSARMLKRIQPAPQGRAHRIRKRSNHVTIFVDKVVVKVVEEVVEEVQN